MASSFTNVHLKVLFLCDIFCNDYIYSAQIAHAYRRRISEELRGRFFGL